MKIFGRGDQFTGWAGGEQFFLVINTVQPDGPPKMHIIDLDEPGWMSEQPDLMRAESEWLLCAKGDSGLDGAVPLLSIRVLPGEQPYYVKRHLGDLRSGLEISVPGIGKKRADGHVDRLWLLPNGIVCAGDDLDIIGVNILQSMAAGADR